MCAWPKVTTFGGMFVCAGLRGWSLRTCMRVSYLGQEMERVQRLDSCAKMGDVGVVKHDYYPL